MTESKQVDVRELVAIHQRAWNQEMERQRVAGEPVSHIKATRSALEALGMAELITDARRAVEAWDMTTLPRVNDGMMQERMECLRAQLNVCGSMPDDENPEWTEGDFQRAEPAKEVLDRLFGKAASEVEAHDHL